MRTRRILLFGLLVLLSLAMLPAEEDSISACVPTFPGGAGEWILDVDGACWYLHTEAEFDALPSDCYACHDGIQAAEW